METNTVEAREQSSPHPPHSSSKQQQHLEEQDNPQQHQLRPQQLEKQTRQQNQHPSLLSLKSKPEKQHHSHHHHHHQQQQQQPQLQLLSEQNEHSKMQTGQKRAKENKTDSHFPKKTRHSMSYSNDTDTLRCVTCRQPFQSIDDLSEHLADRIYLADNPKSGSENRERTNLQRRCIIRDCFLCDFAPDLDTDLGSRYRTIQDHIITIHFKAYLPHLMTSHTEIPRAPASSYLCQKCGKEFSEEGQLFNHRSLLCEVAFQCDFCTFNFQRVEKLAEHVKTCPARRQENSCTPKMMSHGKYTFRCTLCGKVFMSEELLRNHANIFHSKKLQI